MDDKTPSRWSSRLKFSALAIFGFGLILALIFLPAGRLAWAAGWLYFGLLTAGWLATSIAVRLKNPGLLTRRMTVGKGTKGWDRAILALFRLTTFGTIVVGGLDAGRYGWSTMPGWSLPVGIILFVAGYWFTTWAMATNAHFEGTVRIQTDQGHKVVDQGPYRFVRHPGYVGFLLVFGATPFVLGSVWSVLPAALSLVVLIVRTAFEDRTLKAELEGYAEYAGRVRYRLIPGLW